MADSLAYEKLSFEEKNLYLEGKLEILQRNARSQADEYAKESQVFIRERSALYSRIERMKEEVRLLKEEVREKRAEMVGAKRPKIEERKDKEIPIEWILSNIKGTIEFELTHLDSGKLKKLGRFFKREFDSMYNQEKVLAEITPGETSTRQFVKTILYLSDRPEIVCSLLPYIFKKHIISIGSAFVKEVVRILYKTGVASFLVNSDIVGDIRVYFEECSDSLDLLFFVETLSERSPKAIARLVSEEYLKRISVLYPRHAQNIIKHLDVCGVQIRSERACEILYTSPLLGQDVPYTCTETNLAFWF